jgi:O-antigen biosynthesis protein
MQSNGRYRGFESLANAVLIALIHIDAFRFDPTAYLKAAKWWVMGKRVRARGQLAPLLSRSKRAYLLWVLRENTAALPHTPPGQMPPIIALVGAGANPAAIDRTLQNLAAENVPAIVISADQGVDLAKAAQSIDWQQSPWILPMRAGDQLATGAAAVYRQAMLEAKAVVLYADDDWHGKWQRRTAPHFKPDWNSELFAHFDYLSGAAIVRAQPAELTALSECVDWDVRLVAQAASRGGAHHVRQMLHHRASRPQLPVKAAPLSVAADLPPVSVIIPTRNRLDLLRTCLDGVAAADYPDVDVIVVDNDSDDPATLAYLAAQDPARVRVLRHAGPFNYSAINNRAVSEARGRLLCLLNNDIEVMAPDWLAIMATQALRGDVGAVGAQLLYPDGRIQHAGVVIGVGNAAGHAHRFIHPAADGYFRRHALPQFVSAVTGACLVVARDRFLAVGGLDEANFAVAFNDVDLCLRLNQRGWQSLYEPRAVLIHHESVSRGDDRDPVGAARFAGELAALQRIWKTDQLVDPFHHPELSRASEQFAVAL